MRTRQVVFAALLTLACLVPAQEALAQRGSKGWLERLSGPGPFSGWDVSSPAIVCFGTDGSHRWFYEYGTDAERICLDVDYGWFDTDDDPEQQTHYGKVKAKTFDLGVMYELHRSVSLGGSVGLIRFSGNFDDFSRFALAPVKVVFKPLELGPSRDRREDKWRSLLRFDFEEYLVSGRLEGGDFGDPTAQLNENWEPVAYWSVGVDFSEYLKR